MQHAAHADLRAPSPGAAELGQVAQACVCARPRALPDQRTALLAAAERCVRDDGADVIILAGAPLVVLARSLGHELTVPVVDGVSSAVRHAQSMVALRPRSPRSGSFAQPPLKPNQGLPAAIEALLRRAGG